MDIHLGSDAVGRPIIIPEKALATHLHILGSTGTGKSKALEHIIRQLIIEKQGMCLIDPNGALYNDVVRWCAACGWPRRIHLLNPHMQGWGFGFNPFQGSADASVRVDASIVACAQVFGGEDMDAKPRLVRILRTVFMALIANGLTLADALLLLEAERGQELRSMLELAIDDPIAAQSLRELTLMRHREFTEMTESTLNRLTAFLAPPTVRRIVSQQTGIDFLKCMNDGDIVLLNLNPGHTMSEQNARLLGTLFVNALFANARMRGTGKRPFYLIVDEAYRYLTEDVEKILDEGRKFGLHLILAHQRIGQLEAAGENILSAVMGMARTKIVFGGLTPEEAEMVESYLFMGTYDLQRVKARITNPVTVRHELMLLANRSRSLGTSFGTSESSSESLSDGAGFGVISGDSHSVSASRTAATSATEGYDPNDEDQEAQTATRGQSDIYGMSISRSASRSTSANISRSRGTSQSHATSWSQSESESNGLSESLRPIVEERATQSYSLQEQRYERAAEIRNLKQRHAIVKLPDSGAVSFKTATIVEQAASAERILRFNRQMLEASDATRPIAEIEQEIIARTRALAAKVASQVLIEDVPFGETATLPARRRITAK
jgi:Type IV secretion-system coupling protein DNA-binding domain